MQFNFGLIILIFLLPSQTLAESLDSVIDNCLKMNSFAWEKYSSELLNGDITVAGHMGNGSKEYVYFGDYQVKSNLLAVENSVHLVVTVKKVPEDIMLTLLPGKFYRIKGIIRAIDKEYEYSSIFNVISDTPPPHISHRMKELEPNHGKKICRLTFTLTYKSFELVELDD